MKTTCGCLSNYETRAMAANRGSGESVWATVQKRPSWYARETFLRSVLLQFAPRKSGLETKQSRELWVLFMVGPLPDDAGNNRAVGTDIECKALKGSATDEVGQRK